MDPIYNYSLCAALPLMLFFGFYFLLGRTPEKAVFGVRGKTLCIMHRFSVV